METTYLIFSALILILSILAFFAGKMLGTKNEVISEKEYMNLTNEHASLKSLFDKQKEDFLALKESSQRVKDNYNSLNGKYERLDAIRTSLEEKYDDLEKKYLGLEKEYKENKGQSEGVIEDQREKLSVAQAKISGLTSKNEQLEENLLEQKKRFERDQENLDQKHINALKQMEEKFKVLSQEIFEEKGLKFKQQSSESLKTILDPLKDQLKGFKENIDQKYNKENAAKEVLKSEIQKLIDVNNLMSQETQNLTTALKGDVKKQGAWGEIKLELILENSGLEKGREYFTQGGGMNLKNEDGGTQLPDVIINLPDNKHVVVDSKVSLKSYYEYVEADSEEKRNTARGRLTESIKGHIDGLSGKKYEMNTDLFTPEFVFIFFPLEGALSLVIDQELPRIQKSLMQYAWDKSIVIVTPSTLMATLKTISSIWNIQKQEANALKIAEIGSKLYDKFEGFINDMKDIGKQIDRTQGVYDNAFRKLHIGPGNLIRQAHNMKALGLKTKKEIDSQLVDQALADSPQTTDHTTS